MLANIFSIPVTVLFLVGSVGVWSNIYSSRWSALDFSFGLSTCVATQQWYRVFSAPFTHKVPQHLFLNVFAVWGCCSRVEELYGSLFFLKYSILLMILEPIAITITTQIAVLVYRNRKAASRWFANVSLSGLYAYGRGIYSRTGAFWRSRGQNLGPGKYLKSE